MLTNPIVTNTYIQRSIIFICVLIGGAYAFSFGLSMHISILDMCIDGFISAVLFFTEAIILWNIFTYSIPKNDIRGYQLYSLYLLYCTIGIVFIIGVEFLFCYLFFQSEIKVFVDTIPARILCLIFLYCIYYSFYQKIKPDEEYEDESDSMEDKPLLNSVTDVPAIERITVRIGSKIKVIPVKDLLYIKAEDDYVSLVTAEGHWLKDETMKSYEVQLPSDQFVRIHRSYIVNIEKISKIERYGQSQSLQLFSGEHLRVSANGYRILRERLHL